MVTVVARLALISVGIDDVGVRSLTSPWTLGTLALGVVLLVVFAVVGELAVQTTLPPERSAEGTSVLLTVLTAVGGIGVVVATAAIDGPVAALAEVRAARRSRTILFVAG